ncbi:hypothetical protein ACET3X_006815 [Alternaria dauci]|uniref:Protein artemis n=1 Tax=Alternaria dauci TaxID=48095 RepID=A0ABR3UGN1_9PLEO
MSTFKGIIAEFPQIRIDYFRQQPEHKAPLACFLSHVHSDHLVGLESLRAPFVYCSAATREILLRLEKFHYRVNFAKGILESRNVTYDRSMRKLAKALPLDTPTLIELTPGNSIRVTLIDANHCVGAVMFLIEGNGKAILYTGDVRAEEWWINSIVQNPVLLPYSLGNRTLDCMYLDTTFATKKKPYRQFPSKAQGIQELLGKVSEYAHDTIFYFHSWTFGYENVWIALSAFLDSRIHLDEYRARIYGSLSTLDKRQLREAGLDVPASNKPLQESGLEIREAPALCGFKNGNHIQTGCLTSHEHVRIHSCERGMGCSVLDGDMNAAIVHIIPIVTRADGVEIAEIGAGGGKGDLDQKEELESSGLGDVDKLMELCAASINDEHLLTKVLALLQQTLVGDGKLDLDMQLQKQVHDTKGDVSLKSLVSILSSFVSKDSKIEPSFNRTIRFPYSRHSSYSELRGLVRAFSPKDVFPCTVDDAHWTPELSMGNLFGDLCSGALFRHDTVMMETFEARLAFGGRTKRSRRETPTDTQITEDGTTNPIATKHTHGQHVTVHASNDLASARPNKSRDVEVLKILPTQETPLEHTLRHRVANQSPEDRDIYFWSVAEQKTSASDSSSVVDSLAPSFRKRRRKTNRQLAYDAAIGDNGLSWSDYGGLVSARSKFA